MVEINKNCLMILVTVLISIFNLYSQDEPTVPFSDYTAIDVGIVRIEYELGNVTDENEYEIEIYCTRRSDSNFVIIPKNLKGDVRKLNSVIGRKKIIWEMTKEEIEKLQKLDAQDFRFIIKPEKLGGIPWFYFVGGAIVGGGVAIVLLINKPPETESTYASFPQRPE